VEWLAKYVRAVWTANALTGLWDVKRGRTSFARFAHARSVKVWRYASNVLSFPVKRPSKVRSPTDTASSFLVKIS
jgi:hypothetical protein